MFIGYQSTGYSGNRQQDRFQQQRNYQQGGGGGYTSNQYQRNRGGGGGHVPGLMDSWQGGHQSQQRGYNRQHPYNNQRDQEPRVIRPFQSGYGPQNEKKVPNPFFNKVKYFLS